MKNLSKKMLLSILTVVLTFIALGTTTFAWFTLGGTVTVSSFNANVTSGDGIEVSLDGTTWGNNLDLSQLVTTFVALTTNDGKEFYSFDATSSSDHETTGYADITIYIRTTTTNKDVYLSGVTFGTSTDNDGTTLEDWTADVTTSTFSPTYGLLAGKAYKFDPLNAIKVSFATGVNSTTNTTAADKTAAIAATPEVFYAIENQTTTDLTITPVSQATGTFDEDAIYYTRTGTDSNFTYTKETTVTATNWDDKKANLYTVTNVAQAAASSWGTPSKTGLAKEYSTLKNQTISTYINSDLAIVPVGNYVTSATTATLSNVAATAAASGDNDATFRTRIINAAADWRSAGTADAAGYYYCAIQMRIWLEGWDPDCINAILTKKTSFSFSLTAADRA